MRRMPRAVGGPLVTLRDQAFERGERMMKNDAPQAAYRVMPWVDRVMKCRVLKPHPTPIIKSNTSMILCKQPRLVLPGVNDMDGHAVRGEFWFS